MKRKKSGKFKGFGKPPAKKYTRMEDKESGEWVVKDYYNLQLDKHFDSIDKQTEHNRSQPSALKNFRSIVEEGNTEKLTVYFNEQYDIAPNIARLNLESLIKEELRDLSKSEDK